MQTQQKLNLSLNRLNIAILFGRKN